MNDFYVYVHYRLDNNSPFYVGKGRGNRAYKTHGRSEYWRRVSNKYGFLPEIIFDNLSEEEAFQVEKDCILELRDFGYGLVNMTNGGEGTSGLVLSNETREKISKAHTGRKRSKEEIEKSAKARRGLKKSASQIAALRQRMLGNTFSEETLKKLSDYRKENPVNIDLNTYLFVNKNGDLFCGTRRELCAYSDIQPKSLNNLFAKNNTAMSAKGWSLISFDLFKILVLLQNNI